MKQRIDVGTRMAGEKAHYPDEFITASQAATRFLLVPEFNGQTLFDLEPAAVIAFLPITERNSAQLVINGVTYWQPLAFTFVESDNHLYVSWADTLFSLSTTDEIYLVRQ